MGVPLFENQAQPSDRVSRVAATPRELILAAARKLFAQDEYDDVHVSRLIAEAGVSRATFYRLFASKEDVFTEARSEQLPRRRNALDRAREGAREAIGQFGYERVKMDDMIAAAGVARSTFYRFFKDKASVFLELDRTAFKFLRWEIGLSSVHPDTRDPHLLFTVESFVEWRSQVGRTSLEPGCFPEEPEYPMVAFHTLVDIDPDSTKARLDNRLPAITVNALLVAVDTIAQQPFEGDRKQQNARRVQAALALLRPAVRAPSGDD